MTHLIIHNDTNIRINSLLSLTSKLLEKEFISVENLIKNPDIHYLEITDKKGIGINEVKKLQQEIQFQPFQEIKQIGIVFNAHTLTIQAQNAFLKTLEEVSPTTAFILLVNNEKNLLDTIISRSIKHYISGKNEEKNETKPEILNMEIHEQFKTIEGISKEGNPIELVDQIIRYYRLQFRESITNNRNNLLEIINSNLKIATTSKKRLMANGNKRLVLENLLLQTSSLD